MEKALQAGLTETKLSEAGHSEDELLAGLVPPDKEAWLGAEALSEAQKLFVLWMVARRLCVSHDDFARHFGRDFPYRSLVRELKVEGFLREAAGRLALTRVGESTLTYLTCQEPTRNHCGLCGNKIEDRAVTEDRTSGRNMKAQTWFYHEVCWKHLERMRRLDHSSWSSKNSGTDSNLLFEHALRSNQPQQKDSDSLQPKRAE